MTTAKKNAAKTALMTRVLCLTDELHDATCARYPLARAQVQRELDAAIAALEVA